MATTMMIIAVYILGIIVVDGCPIVTSVNGSCCDIVGNDFKFSTSFRKSHVYNITNFCGDCELVAEGYCDAVTAGGGWLVIQRRKDGSVDFNRDWVDYENGFGDLTGEVWYGLRAIHCLTNQGQWELRIDYTFTNGTKGYLSYSHFKVGPANKQYPLTISGFDGITDDPFSTHPLNSMKFSTKDQDNDNNKSANCAVRGDGGSGGGWWYNKCSHFYPNRRSRQTVYLKGWHTLPFIEIKVRPKNCKIV